ncbi:glycosyltransferase family 2 protein [Streptomyces sp. B21-105]|uniref:glycosyltransferase family 2 protein n=1 Tax=Streptomyces sp. B21-105 TaxID=3039417 RepID=UPI002FF3170D
MTTSPIPTVSVVVPVYNAMPYLERTLASVAQQSIGADAIEVIAVDDGSTDGSGEFLDTWADQSAFRMEVIHQEASGGPSRPRNVGLDHASGTYVFFLDGDDCLGPQALERLVAMAEKNGSDTVLAKLIGVGRKVPKQLFAKNVDKVDLAKGDVYYSLMPFKLFRRDMIETHQIRFPEHMRISEDQYFVAQAYLHSKVISIVGNYDCYYVVKRGDDGNITAGGLDYRIIVEQAAQMVDLITQLTGPGALRDQLVRRHVHVELLGRFDRRYLDADGTLRAEYVTLARPYAQAWVSPAILAQLTLAQRLRVHCLREGLVDELASVIAWDLAGQPGKAEVRDGKLYAAAPLPPAAYTELCDITACAIGASPRRRVEHLAWHGGRIELSGYAYLDQVDTDDLTTEVILRHTGTGREITLPAEPIETPHLSVSRGKETYDYGRAGFRATIDLATASGSQPLDNGAWHLSLRCTAHGLTARGNLGSALGPDVPRRPLRHSIPGSRRSMSIGPRDGQLSLQIGAVSSAVSSLRRNLGKAIRLMRDTDN